MLIAMFAERRNRDVIAFGPIRVKSFDGLKRRPAGALILACLLGYFLSQQAAYASRGDRHDDYAGPVDRTSARAERGNFRLDTKEAGASTLTIKTDALDEQADDDKSFADRLGLRERSAKSDMDGSADPASAVSSLSADDSNFARNSYVDLLIGDDFGTASMNDLRDPLKDDYLAQRLGKVDGSKADQAGDDRLYAEKKNFLDREKDREQIERRQEMNYDELIELYAPPPPVGPNHWVPDKLDPIQTGAFTTSPDNGSPVPYRLNGHVDLERSTPWLLDHESLPERLLH
ncbi:MAG: hypothetical protein KGS72_05505 [Cyanobacteria bacterium REEB67]|nr:hypothetical protein [Cyanobacteria bacterium REEB67]